MRGRLSEIPGLEVVRVLRPRVAVSALSVSADEATEAYVVRVDPDRAEFIRQTLAPQLIMEEDGRLTHGQSFDRLRAVASRLATWSFTGGIETRPIRIRVVGEDDRPLASVGVSLAGEGPEQEGRTDKRGEVTLPLLALAGHRPRALFVHAPNNYWDQYLAEPDLSEADVNVVRLRPLAETVAGFPEFRYGWGQLQMGLHRISETLTGQGARVALIDSGADASHPLLRHLRHGHDFTKAGDPLAWTQDAIGRGSHGAGILAARDDAGRMLRGFAPEAEIHALKVVPGGRLSSVMEALDYCLEREVDVVSIGVGSAGWSELLEQKLEEVALQGLACIVGAGDAGGLSEYPGSSPHILAVAAVGRLNECPDTAWDAATVWPGLVAADGLFLPSAGPLGPHVAVCAPGLAVVSTVPGGFQAQSGTAVAAAHVTGLAALLLAHHAAFQGPLRARDRQRVAGLFSMIRLSCVPYAFGPMGTGVGLPRLHGLEQVLQPRGAEATTAGNGRARFDPVSTPAPILAPPWGWPVLLEARRWP
jgi:subtilisin family serine protease